MRRLALTVVLATFAGCATSGGAKRAAAPTPASSSTSSAAPLEARPRAERLFTQANDAYAEQDKAGAVSFADVERRYQDAAAADPTFAEPEYNLGVLLEREGKSDAAVAAYTEALHRKPGLVRASESLALVDMRRGRDGDAQRILEAAAKASPADAGVRARLAELSLRHGDQANARTWAREALMRDAQNIVAYRVLLDVALAQGEEDMVRLLALRAQKARPEDPMPSYFLGRLAMRHGDLQKAATAYKASLSLRPDFEPALIESAKLALANRDYAGAEADLRKVLQLDPRACSAHLDLGVCERGLGRPDDAASEYTEAVKCDPKLIQSYYDLGLLQHHQKNDCAAAIDSYQKFISGNAAPLPGDHPVFVVLKECQDRKAADDQKASAPAAPAPASAANTQGAAPTPAHTAQAAPSDPKPVDPNADPNEPKN